MMQNVKKKPEKSDFKPFAITLGKGHGKDCGIVIDGKPLSYIRSFTLNADVRDVVHLHIDRYVIQEEAQDIEGIGSVQERVVFGVFSIPKMIDFFDDKKIVIYSVGEMGEQWKENYVVDEKEARCLYENLKEIFG